MLGRNGTVVDCQEVDPGIALGRIDVCTDLPLPTNAVLNLCAEMQPVFQPNGLESWQGGRMHAYARMPILDGDFPGLVWLQAAINQVLTWRTCDWNALILCRLGMSRSAMVVAGVLMTLHGWSLEEALAKMREKRPQVQPNPRFMAGLLELQAALAQQGLLTEGVASKSTGEVLPANLSVLDGGITQQAAKEAN